MASAFSFSGVIGTTGEVDLFSMLAGGCARCVVRACVHALYGGLLSSPMRRFGQGPGCRSVSIRVASMVSCMVSLRPCSARPSLQAVSLNPV